MRLGPLAGPTSAPKSYPNVMGRPGGQPGQRSLAEMAHEQINGGRSRDKLADSVQEAVKPECFGKDSGTSVGLLALPIGAIQALRGKCN